MTLAESKMTKVMTIAGTFTGVDDLTDLWFEICVFKTIKIAGAIGQYTIEFRGDWTAGLYILGLLVEGVRRAKKECHIVIGAEYE